MNRHHWSAALGVGCCLFALITLLGWIPMNVESGVIEKVRRQVVIGDAMAPTVWSIGIGVLGLLLALASLLRLREGVRESPDGGPTWANLRYLLLLVATIVGALLVMTHAGPLVVGIAQSLGSDVDSYRSLRATRSPWRAGFWACPICGVATATPGWIVRHWCKPRCTPAGPSAPATATNRPPCCGLRCRRAKNSPAIWSFGAGMWRWSARRG